MFSRGDPVWFQLEDGRRVKGTFTQWFLKSKVLTVLYDGALYMVPVFEADREEYPARQEPWYTCKSCGDPVFVAVEGELVCPDCWNEAQMSEAEAQAEQQIREYQRWAASHCEHCGEPSEGGALHPQCQAEREQIERELWPDIYDQFEQADWGDGSLSPEEELRRAALDHKGRP